MVVKRHDLDWRWVRNTDVSRTLLFQSVYRFYANLALVILDVILLTAVILQLGVFTVIYMFHLANMFAFRLNFISLEEFDAFRHFYDFGLTELSDVRIDISEFIGTYIGLILVLSVGNVLLIGIRRLLLSLLRDRLLSLIVVLISMLVFFGGIVTATCVRWGFQSCVRDSYTPSFVGSAIFYTALVAIHLIGRTFVHRSRYVRLESEIRASGFRSVFRRYSLDRLLVIGEYESALFRLALKQLAYASLYGACMVSLIYVVHITTPFRSTLSAISSILIASSLVAFVVAAFRCFKKSEYVILNIVVILFLFVAYGNMLGKNQRIYGIVEYFNIIVMMSAFSFKYWLFKPVREMIVLARSRSIISAPHLIFNEQRGTALLLRSFADDDERVSSSRGNLNFAIGGKNVGSRLEDVIVAALAQRFGLVTLSDPRGRPHATGAARATLSDDGWTDYVVQRMHASKVIIVIAGSTPSLSWEISESIRHGLAKKMIFVIPPAYFASNKLSDLSLDLPGEMNVSGDGVEAGLGASTRVIGYDALNSSWHSFSAVGKSERAYAFCLGASVALAEQI